MGKSRDRCGVTVGGFSFANEDLTTLVVSYLGRIALQGSLAMKIPSEEASTYVCYASTWLILQTELLRLSMDLVAYDIQSIVYSCPRCRYERMSACRAEGRIGHC